MKTTKHYKDCHRLENNKFFDLPKVSVARFHGYCDEIFNFFYNEYGSEFSQLMKNRKLYAISSLRKMSIA